MCKHLQYYEGYRSGPSNYTPAFSWGGYFPGDEPGLFCAKTDGDCDPDNCPYGEEYQEENGLENY